MNVSQAMSALDERTRAERALKDLQKVQGEQQVLFHVWSTSYFIVIGDILSLLSISLLQFLFVIIIYINTVCHCAFYALTWIWNGMYAADQCVLEHRNRHLVQSWRINTQLNWFVVSLSFKFAAQSQEINCLEDTVAALKEDYERSLNANAVSHKDLQENLISAKHELLRVQEQLTLAEKVPRCGLHPQGKKTPSEMPWKPIFSPCSQS